MEKKHIAFTICTKTYFAGALVWRKTLTDFNTRIRGLIFVVDAEANDLPGLYSEAKTICSAYAEGLKNDLRCVSDEEIPDNLGMRHRYDIIEYCTAIKPSIFLLLAEQFPGCVLHYFDPDIIILGELLKLREFSEEHSITLIPHMTTPTEDNFTLSQLAILRAGVFNFGYVGWNPNIKSGWTLIQWWQRRLNKDCRVALDVGIFTDQSWGVFFCSSPEAGILYDLAYNVAYWNLHERNIDWTSQSGYTCNGEKLQFFHFSGYSPIFPSRLSLHQNRHQLEGLRGLSRLFTEYDAELRSAGFEKWKLKNTILQKNQKEYSCVKQHKIERSFLLKDSTSACIYNAFKDPNNSRIIYGITWWILYITLKLSDRVVSFKKLLRNSSYHIKAELIIREKHVFTSLTLKGIAYWRYFIIEIIKSFFQQSKQNDFIANNKKSHIPTASSDSLSVEVEPPLEFATCSNPKNIAVVGYITAETGLGESVRGIIRSLDRGNISADLYDISRHYARSMDVEFSSRICDGSGPRSKYKTCLLHVNADQVPHILREMPGSLLKMAEHRIGYWYWETETLPYGQAAAANYFDEIWVATEFVREALISSGVKIPVRVIPPALSALPKAPYGRSYFKLPEDRPICLSVFDATSFLGRKNPIAVIQSIKEICDNEDEIKPLLVLKTTNLKDSDREELLRLASPVDLHIINQYLSREETLSLVGLADCFVSLHRAEGLGLSLIDAMRLGTPLVATDYSGPKDFANDDNSFIVPWDYCKARWEDGPYYGSTWAEPDISTAAKQIRKALKKGEAVNNRVVLAKKKVEEHFARQRISALIKEALV